MEGYIWMYPKIKDILSFFIRCNLKYRPSFRLWITKNNINSFKQRKVMFPWPKWGIWSWMPSILEAHLQNLAKTWKFLFCWTKIYFFVNLFKAFIEDTNNIIWWEFPQNLMIWILMFFALSQTNCTQIPNREGLKHIGSFGH